MPRREELPVQEEEQFPIGRARRSSGMFDYVFGRGGNDNDEGDSGSYDPARRSTMW
jgi:hypothetical protein